MTCVVRVRFVVCFLRGTSSDQRDRIAWVDVECRTILSHCILFATRSEQPYPFGSHLVGPSAILLVANRLVVGFSGK